MDAINIPEGYQRVMPYLILKDSAGFIEFCKEVFDATEKMRHMRNETEIMHAEVQIGESTIMFGEASDQWKSQNAGLFVFVKDADATFRKALENGAITIMQPSDREYGRSGGIKDPFGNTWWITSPLESGTLQ